MTKFRAAGAYGCILFFGVLLFIKEVSMKTLLRRAITLLLSFGMLLLWFAQPGLPFTALADSSYATHTTTVTFSESQQRSQSQTVTISRLRSVVGASVNTGDVSCAVNGSSVTVSVSNGSPSRSYTPSKTATSSLTYNTNSFPSTVGYNDGTYSGTLGKNGGVSTNPYANYINSPSGYFYWYASDTNLYASTPPWPVSYIGGSASNGYGGGNPSDYPQEYTHNYISWNGGAFYASWAGQVVRQVYLVYNHYSPNYTQNYAGTVYAATQYYYSYAVTLTYTTQGPSIALTESGWSSNGVTVTASISDSSGIAVQKWAPGNQTTAYFSSGGNAFTGSTFTAGSNGTYTVFAKDGDGNSATQVITIDHNDTSPPAGSYSLSPSGWTHSTVTITVTAADAQSGVRQITRPDGSVINGATATYDVTSDGTFHFTLIDNVGNSTAYTVSVDKIDTAAPTGSATLTPSTYTSRSVTINFTAADEQSGIATIKEPDGTTVSGSSASYSAISDGTYDFVITDHAGNSATVPVAVDNITQQISVTHPVSVSYTIDPNESPVFTAPDFQITNNSLIPVRVAISGMPEASGGTITLRDVPPTQYSDWSKLTSAQTESSIAMGINVAEKSTGPDTWSEIVMPNPLYAASISGNVELGVLNAGGSGNLSLSALCGLAWSRAFVEHRQLLFVFDCA